MLGGLETSLLGRRRRIQASEARRKEGKFAKMRVGSFQELHSELSPQTIRPF